MTEKSDTKKYLVDIFNLISHGLREDYMEPETGHVWKVSDYLQGKTEGIRVYTKYGMFLGTAYYSPRYDQKKRSTQPDTND